MRQECAEVTGGKCRPSSAQLYDRLERAVIALEYALADARCCETQESELDEFVRSLEALQGAGEEVTTLLVQLKTAGLQSAAERAHRFG